MGTCAEMLCCCQSAAVKGLRKEEACMQVTVEKHALEKKQLLFYFGT